jgi:disulfide bond formation protein DsbB
MTDTASASNGDDPGGAHASGTDHTTLLRLSPQEWRVLGKAAAVLAAAAAIVQVVGTSGESPAKSVILAAITIVAGGLGLVLITRIAPARKRKVQISYLLASGLLIVTGAAGGLAGYGISWALSPKPHTTAAPRPLKSGHTRTPASGQPTSSATTSPTPSATQPSEPSRPYAEITDNRQGTQVFSNPQGDAVTQNEVIPFDTHVRVKCWANNESAMTSINAFYLVETAPWAGDYAPADTFANGDPVGQPGSTTIDPAVPECH